MLVDSPLILVNIFDKTFGIAIFLMTFEGEKDWSYQFDMSYIISKQSSNLPVDILLGHHALQTELARLRIVDI